MAAAVARRTGAEWAKRAYEGTAVAYDDFTAHYEDEAWLADLLGVLKRHGLQGNRLLDVGCGTGKSFMPMLPRGWEVTGCDISPSMLGLAREKAGEAVLAALEQARLECLDIYGIYTDGVRRQPLDESIHTKAIYVARRPQAQGSTQRSR